MKILLPILIISGIISGCAIVKQAQNDAITTYEQTKDFVEETTNQVQDNYNKTKEEFENTTQEVKQRIEKTTEDVKKASLKIEETYKDVLNAQEQIQQAADAINKISN
jgi:outer membrane protein TolC